MQHAAHLSPRQKREKSSADGDFETLSPASPLYCDNVATASAFSLIKQIKRSVLSPIRIDFVFLPLSQTVKSSSASAFINPFLKIEKLRPAHCITASPVCARCRHLDNNFHHLDNRYSLQA